MNLKKKHCSVQFQEKYLKKRCVAVIVLIEVNKKNAANAFDHFDPSSASDRIVASERTRHDANVRYHCCNRTWVVRIHIPRYGPQWKIPLVLWWFFNKHHWDFTKICSIQSMLQADSGRIPQNTPVCVDVYQHFSRIYIYIVYIRYMS